MCFLSSLKSILEPPIPLRCLNYPVDYIITKKFTYAKQKEPITNINSLINSACCLQMCKVKLAAELLQCDAFFTEVNLSALAEHGGMIVSNGTRGYFVMLFLTTM